MNFDHDILFEFLPEEDKKPDLRKKNCIFVN